jgi:hypothetical protein
VYFLVISYIANHGEYNEFYTIEFPRFEDFLNYFLFFFEIAVFGPNSQKINLKENYFVLDNSETLCKTVSRMKRFLLFPMVFFTMASIRATSATSNLTGITC